MKFIKGTWGKICKHDVLFGTGLVCTYLWKKRYVPDYMVLVGIGMTSFGFCSMILHSFKKDSKRRGEQITEETAEADGRQSTTGPETQATETNQGLQETNETACRSPVDGEAQAGSNDAAVGSGRLLKHCANDFRPDNEVARPGTSQQRIVNGESENRQLGRCTETTSELCQKMNSTMTQQLARQQMLADGTTSADGNQIATENENLYEGNPRRTSDDSDEKLLVYPQQCLIRGRELRHYADKFARRGEATTDDAEESDEDIFDRDGYITILLSNSPPRNDPPRGEGSPEDNMDDVFLPNSRSRRFHRRQKRLKRRLCDFFRR